jgi:sterol desaturase/sphingolipid hydroxylase (fatty acid hydroxylase superfamily)
MLKRLLNVFTIVCTIYLLTLIGVMLTGGVSNWVEFIGSNFFPLAGAYLLIVIINYVAYSQITLWHKNKIVKNVHNET